MSGLRGIASDMAERSNLERDFLYNVLTLFVECVIDRIQAGDEVELTGLCSFRIRELKPVTRILPNGEATKPAPQPRRVIRVHPRMSLKLRGEKVMTDEGMEKYGVELDDKKKEAEESEGGEEKCPWCGKELDSGGACPEHGTEPFERRE